MTARRRRFQRPLGKRRYRAVFVVVTEGSKTEPQYFRMLDDQVRNIHIDCTHPRTKSSPDHLLQWMKNRLSRTDLREGDEAWIVMDKDEWDEDDIAPLHTWSRESPQYHLALSNPKFEFWLLLHFEDAIGATTSQECLRRLRRYLPNYNKDIDSRRFPMQSIRIAIDRAEQRDRPRCDDWPRQPGCTTVYRLVQNILSKENQG